MVKMLFATRYSPFACSRLLQRLREILDQVGSYGRQLGRIGEALEVLVKHLPRGKLKQDEIEALEAFSVQMREIAKIKKRMAA